MTDPDSTKRCCCCEVVKPHSDFYRRKSGKKAGMLSYCCKPCDRAKRKEYQDSDPERAKAQSRASYERNREKALQRVKERAETMREELAAYQRQYREEHKEDKLSYNHAYYAANKEAIAVQKRAYNEANREKVREWHRNKKARRRAAEGKHTAADVAAKLKEQKGSCYWCGAELDGEYHVDHIFPISKGGSNWPANICCACPPCNMRKHDKEPWEFAGRLF